MMNLVLRKVESLSGRLNSINVEWLHLLYIWSKSRSTFFPQASLSSLLKLPSQALNYERGVVLYSKTGGGGKSPHSVPS